MANNEDKSMKDKLMDKLKKLFGNDLPDLDMDIPDTLDDSLDDMGLEDEEREMLIVALKENRLGAPDGNGCYEHYSPSNRGCSRKKPFVLSELENYVHLEYLIMRYITQHNPCRMEHFVLNHQNLCQDDGHTYDMLCFDVVSLDGAKTTEQYWFDITQGYKHRMQ